MARVNGDASSSLALGKILTPDESEPPILNPDVRSSAFSWIHEFNASDDLLAVGVKPRHTMLFFGPPGTGKTTLAHHLCARAGLDMLLVSATDIQAIYVGESELRIAMLFAGLQGKEEEIALFFDEVDGLAPKRSAGQGYAASNTANLLSLMRHLDHYSGLVICATNRFEALDEAFVRRMEFKVLLGPPDEACRRAIIVRYLAPMKLPSESIDILARLLRSASPALIKQTMEGVKRDLVMAPRLNLNADAASVFARVRATVQPASSDEDIPFWKAEGISASIAKLAWPPTWDKRDAEAA